MVLITDATLDSTSTIAQRIWSQVGITHIEVDNSIIDLSASGGVATFPIHGKTVELLVKHADEAMYKAKHTGKNKVIIT
jgi:diguanylate cyclase (GGDEF)-like protein